MKAKIKIAIADDHLLFRKGLAQLLADDIFNIQIQADNGKDLIDQLTKNPDIQVVLMDVNMPIMNGFEATEWIKQNMPKVKVLALTMSDADMDVIKMIRSGAKGYLLKDSEIFTLKSAIVELAEKGFFHSEMISSKLMNTMSEESEESRNQRILASLAPHELDYIKYACSDMSHKEIGIKVGMSHRTIDGYRDSVYAKTGLTSRVGLVLFAIKNGIFKI
ncbi:MAG: response regulator transcription factor [Flavobacteriales bacterium]|nr:response regulator transcription factor [Flavobacteriales bacterium]